MVPSNHVKREASLWQIQSKQDPDRFFNSIAHRLLEWHLEGRLSAHHRPSYVSVTCPPPTVEKRG